MWWNWNPSTLLNGMSNGTATVGNSMVVPQKTKHRITMWSSNFTSGYIPKRTESKDSNRNLYNHLHSSTMHNSQKVEHKCPSLDKWINEMCYMCTMEYYSAFKRKEILTHAATWMNLEDIMLSEIRQSQKNKHCMIPLIWGTWSSQSHRHRK